MRIPLSRPDITEWEIERVVEVLRSPDLSLGPTLRRFEEAFAACLGRRRAVAVNSGTSGLFLSLRALGIGPGDEVITTPFTFIASVTSIMMTGARPVFVDIDPASLNLDPSRIEAAVTRRTKAILPVEIFGNPARFDEICAIAARRHLLVVEDSCEALGSTLQGRQAGTFGALSVFGFYPNKQITTGEGGMIVTDRDDLADLCVSLRNQGRSAQGAGTEDRGPKTEDGGQRTEDRVALRRPSSVLRPPSSAPGWPTSGWATTSGSATSTVPWDWPSCRDSTRSRPSAGRLRRGTRRCSRRKTG